jgi:hypothetical protein
MQSNKESTKSSISNSLDDEVVLGTGVASSVVALEALVILARFIV